MLAVVVIAVVVALVVWDRHQADNEGARALTAADQALCFEGPHGFTQGGTRDAELFGELGLG